jgi:TrmH family RNA methyltransferase
MERITSRQNPFLKQIGKLNNSKSERRKAGLFPGEGPKLLEEAVKAGVEIAATVSAEGFAINV